MQMRGQLEQTVLLVEGQEKLLHWLEIKFLFNTFILEKIINNIKH